MKKTKLKLKKLVDIIGEPDEKFKSIMLEVLNRDLRSLKIYNQGNSLVLYGIEYEEGNLDILVESVIRGWMFRYGNIYKGSLKYDPTDKNQIQIVLE